MSTGQEIEPAMDRPSTEELRLVRDWIENQLEDQLPMTDEFMGRIESSERQMFQSPPSGRLRLSPLD